MSLKTIFAAIGAWFQRTFNNVKNNLDSVAISVTEGVKQAINSGVLPAAAHIFDSVTGSHISSDIVTLVGNNINKVLAAELALQGLPDHATPEQLTAFEQSVLIAFTGKDSIGKSKLYTALAAQIYSDLETLVNQSEPITFAALVNTVETAYQQYVADQADPNLQ